jgi:hypothetical protein
VVNRPRHYNSYEFVVVSSLRAKQLLAGCLAQVAGDHTAAIAAQMEVADGRVARCADDAADTPRQCEWQL